MDGSPTFGLASSILQFVVFATRVTEGARKLYKSSSDVLEEHEELQDVIEDLRQSTDKLRSSNDDESSVLGSLCSECFKISDELTQILSSLKMPKGSVKWHAVVIALRKETTCKAVQNLKQRLDYVATALSPHEFRHVYGDLLERLSLLRRQNQALIARYEQTTITTIQSEFEERFERSRKDTSQTAILSNEVSSIHQQTRESFAIATLAHCFEFDAIDDRFVQIRQTHKETFRWILNPESPGVNFTKWLTSDELIFWITGKPGSGKSTLVKHIWQSPETTRLLKR